MQSDDLGLVEKLRIHADTQIDDDLRYIRTADDLMREAADALAAKDAAIERLVAENAQMQELMLLADRFCLGKDRRGCSVWVASRGPGSWAVWDGAFVLADDGQWEAEPMPSSRDEAFIARTRYTFADAVRRARQALGDTL